jgi:hypothetical protein
MKTSRPELPSRTSRIVAAGRAGAGDFRFVKEGSGGGGHSIAQIPAGQRRSAGRVGNSIEGCLGRSLRHPGGHDLGRHPEFCNIFKQFLRKLPIQESIE